MVENCVPGALKLDEMALRQHLGVSAGKVCQVSWDDLMLGSAVRRRCDDETATVL